MLRTTIDKTLKIECYIANNNKIITYNTMNLSLINILSLLVKNCPNKNYC